MILRPVCVAAGKTEWQQKLYEAIHLYMMKIAHIKNILQEKHHLQISSIRSEDDLSYEKHGESSKFRR
jgi:hypothetical protein